MKAALLILLALAACSHEPVTFAGPPADAPSWDLNGGHWDDSNDLIHPPAQTVSAP
jgi:hypothetical protein